MTARSGGMALRLSRLSRHSDGRYLFVPMDHSVGDGPIVAARDFNGLVRTAVAGGADAIVVHKGRAATVDPGLLRDCALIVHLSASTSHATDVDAKVLVGDVEEAIQLGADAVSVHVNIGSDTESRQLTDLSSVADACSAVGYAAAGHGVPEGAADHRPARPPAALARRQRGGGPWRFHGEDHLVGAAGADVGGRRELPDPGTGRRMARAGATPTWPTTPPV